MYLIDDDKISWEIKWKEIQELRLIYSGKKLLKVVFYFQYVSSPPITIERADMDITEILNKVDGSRVKRIYAEPPWLDNNLLLIILSLGIIIGWSNRFLLILFVFLIKLGLRKPLRLIPADTLWIVAIILYILVYVFG